MTNKIHSIHFVGIKGVGMTPLAIIAKEAGVIVTGSDVADEYITDISLKNASIQPFVGFSPEHVGEVDLVITTGAHGGFDNKEVKEALEKDIPVITQGEAVGIFMRGEIFGKEQKGISIFGSHGKTTTTAMIATLLKESGIDPSYLIGTSDVPSLGESGHYGKGEYFVAEADEYATEPTYDKTPKLLWQHPKIAVCTNIELDHPDIYNNVEELRTVFTRFINDLPDDGLFIGNGDDVQVQQMISNYSGMKKTFGLQEQNDFRLSNIIVNSGTTTFQLREKDTFIGEFSLQVFGQHNVFNAVAAIVTALSIGISNEVIKKGISAYKGSKRRLEYIGQTRGGAVFYDDYAHHPTEIAASLQALRKSYPEKHLVCIFQPHTYSRTKVLFKEFSNAFTDSDVVILTDIYASAREQPDQSVSIEDLARQINPNAEKSIYLPRPIDVVKYIQEKSFGKDTLIVTMGAGDIYKIAKELL
jgi:UDP-N-acetylmuramate--alanine ligase